MDQGWLLGSIGLYERTTWYETPYGNFHEGNNDPRQLTDYGIFIPSLLRGRRISKSYAFMAYITIR